MTQSSPTRRRAIGICYARFAPVFYVMLLVVSVVGTAQAQYFSAPIGRNVGPNPNWGVAGDFNGDGKPDMAIANTLGASVTIALGSGNGSFISSQDYNTGPNPEGVAVGDFNKDGKLDVAVGNRYGGPSSTGNVSILLGNGDGTCLPAVNYDASTPASLTAIDLNGDGNLDLATASNVTNRVSVLLGKGDGTFEHVTTYPVGVGPDDLVAGDFNGDGKPDLATCGYDGGDINVLLGNGNGAFQSAVSYPFNKGPLRGIAAGDLNGDGNLDLVVTAPNSSALIVMIGKGDGTFQPAVSYYIGVDTNSAKIADFNGDGKLDIAVSDYASAVVVRKGNGDGTLQPPDIYPVERTAFGLFVGDFNMDSKPDLGVVHNGLGRVNILLNSPVPNGTQGAAVNATATAPLTGVQVASFAAFYPSQAPGNVTTTINWGDNTATTSGVVTANGSGGFNISGSHTYGNAGAYTITIQIVDDSGSKAKAISDVTVAKADQTISFNAIPDKSFGIPDFAVSVTASSGLGLSFATNGPCAISGSTVHLTGAGSCTITASQSGNNNYNAAPNVSQSFNIAKAATTTSVAINNASYDGSPHGGTASATGPVGFSQSLTISYTGRNTTSYGPSTSAPTNVGDYTASTSFAGDANYNGSSDTRNYSITKGSQTINFSTVGSKTYGDPAFNVTATASSGLPVNLSIVSGPATLSGNTVTITGAGAVVVGGSQAGDSNYNAAPDASLSITVAKAGQTISFSSLGNKTFGDAPFTVSATGGASGNPVTFSSTTSAVCSLSGDTVTILAAGSCTIRASQAGDSNYNAAANVDRSFTVAKANQTITFGGLSDKTFGDSDFTVSATASSALSVSFTASGQCTVSGNTVHITGAGSCTITASQAGNSNYNAASSVPQGFNISKATATITLSFLSQVYNGFSHAPTVTTTPAGLSYNIVYSQNGSPISPVVNVGSYNVSVTINSSNYQGSASDIFVITKATPSIFWNNPANIVVGTPLSSTQLNATANVQGTFAYNPPSGTILPLGPAQLSVTFTPTDTANYNNATKSVPLTVTPPPPPAFTFSSASYGVNEASGNVPILVMRTGDAAPAVSVDYATSDNAGLTSCNTFNGVASSRCDYANTLGTLRFAAGETTKTIFVPIVDDSYAEGTERFSIRLSNPSTGASLGTVPVATITIADNETVTGTPNPIVDPQFFIRQQYIDFLGREPDPVGWQGWQDILKNCQPTDKSCDRVAISSGFFRSPEFQDRGYFVYRFYPVALGRAPHYSEFMPDMAKISGFLTEEEKEANKVAFVQEFMSRPEFTNRYGIATDPATFVDGLLQTCGLPNHPLRDTWIALLTSGQATRAEVLRALSESKEVYDKYYNESFVVMQYFGYLRRDPDILYLEWIKTMNTNGGDYRDMINGFMNSSEYYLRFGP